MKFDHAKFDPYIKLEVAPMPPSRIANHVRGENEFEAAARKAAEHPRDELACLLSLLQEPRWHAGSWSDEDGGWKDSRHATFLAFDEAKRLIAARIEQLGLDAALVNAYPRSHSTIAESQALWRLSFEERMERFRK